MTKMIPPQPRPKSSGKEGEKDAEIYINALERRRCVKKGRKKTLGEQNGNSGGHPTKLGKNQISRGTRRSINKHSNAGGEKATDPPFGKKKGGGDRKKSKQQT